MEEHTLLTWSWLNVLNKRRYDLLCETFGSLDNVPITNEVFTALHVREDVRFATLERFEAFNAEQYKAALQKQGVSFVSIEDEHYPTQLRTLPDPPVILYYKGSLDVVQQPCIAFVGTRTMSDYGKRVTETFVPPCIQAGTVTVSGLAKGIDTEVAKQTLASNGSTVAVLGTGMGQIGDAPKRRLAEDIVQNGGLILSEYALDVRGDTYTFPARNRIIAGLSIGTVVLEAAHGSGALITADLALDYGREVFCVPGSVYDPQYEGCHSYIANGKAQLATQPADVLQACSIHVPSTKEEEIPFVGNTPEETAIFGSLTTLPQATADIATKAKLEMGTTNATLTMLELQGVAKNVGSSMWVRS